MKSQQFFAAVGLLLATPILLTVYIGGKEKPKDDMGSAGNPQSLCNGSNTCGSSASPCEVDIKRRDSNSASATPNIPNAKSNAPFCVRAGTTITFKSTSKNTGFVLDFGSSSPFDSATVILGGADRPASVVAKKPGTYTYSVGACTAGTIYGMCGEDAAQLIVSAK